MEFKNGPNPTVNGKEQNSEQMFPQNIPMEWLRPGIRLSAPFLSLLPLPPSDVTLTTKGWKEFQKVGFFLNLVFGGNGSLVFVPTQTPLR